MSDVPTTTEKQPLFGVEEWENHLHVTLDEAEIPPLPIPLETLWNLPCPYHSSKTIKDTHILTLIPANVHGQPFTIEVLQKIFQSLTLNLCDGSLSGGRLVNFANLPSVQALQSATALAFPHTSRWILMTKNILPGTRGQSFSSQQSHLKGSYSIPTSLEAILSIVGHYLVTSGTRLFSDTPYAYMRCQELIQGGRAIIGGFSTHSGLFCGIDWIGDGEWIGTAYVFIRHS